MLAPRRVQRELRRLLPLAVITGFTILSLVFLRSVSQSEPNVHFYHRRKVGSIDERHGSNSAERHGSNSAERHGSYSAERHGSNSVEQEPDLKRAAEAHRSSDR